MVDATKFPAAIEAKLPAGAPKVSTMLVDAAGKIPAVPDFPMEIPDLPAPPELPALPELPAGPAGLTRYVSGVTVTPVANPIKQEVIPSPAVGVIPEVIVRRGM
ncbi:unnamed protein product [marine sediment metagenome]|uniref:Uncharacterized protein n=1 Tax=marine sediment metagenome TaxID=412755 RepID=X1KLV0_9ZZZZ